MHIALVAQHKLVWAFVAFELNEGVHLIDAFCELLGNLVPIPELDYSLLSLHRPRRIEQCRVCDDKRAALELLFVEDMCVAILFELRQRSS
jgi:hypothetical protein